MPPYIAKPSPPKEVIATLKRSAIRETLLDLLIKEKKEEITINCGLKALDQIMHMPEYQTTFDQKYLCIADCLVHVVKDFELDPWQIEYNEEVIFE